MAQSQQNTDGLRRALADRIDAAPFVKIEGGRDLKGAERDMIVAALRSLPQPSEAAREALEGMVANFRPFTNKPVGAPNSNARFEQDSQIAAYRAATAALSVPASAPEGVPVAWRWKPLGGSWRYAESDLSFPDGAGTLEPLYAALPAAKAVGDEEMSDQERVFHDICEELGCAYDNEAVLEAIHNLMHRAASPDVRGAVIENQIDTMTAIIADEVGYALCKQTCARNSKSEFPARCRCDELARALSSALQPATPATGGQHG